MDFEEIPADYGVKCGELYLNDEGLITFHCVHCTHIYMEFSKYHQHLILNHVSKEIEYIKEEQEYNTSVNEAENEAFDAEIQADVLQEQEDIFIPDIYSKCDKETALEWTISRCIKEEQDLQIPKEIDNAYAKTNKLLGQIRCKDPSILRKYKCTECDFSCKDKCNLRGHMKRHSNSKQFCCTDCKKEFHTTTELKAHFRRHTGEKPFLCTDCGRTFFTSGMLSAHVKRHKNQRDKECEVCHKKFFDAASLERHLRVHTGQRPFKCIFPGCNSRFKRRNALDGHNRMHENKREHQCSYCPARFNQKCNLNAHQKSKHMVA